MVPSITVETDRRVAKLETSNKSCGEPLADESIATAALSSKFDRYKLGSIDNDGGRTAKLYKQSKEKAAGES